MKILRTLILGIYLSQVGAVLAVTEFIEIAATATQVVKSTVQLLQTTQEVCVAWDQLQKQFPQADTQGVDGDPWITEKSNTGATRERLKQLQEEKLLNVNKEIRPRDNLNRVFNQILGLKEGLKKERDINVELSNLLEQANGCILRNSERILGKETVDGKSIVVGKRYSILRNKADECLFPFLESVNGILGKDENNNVVTLPEKQTSNLSEEASPYEWRVGMRATHFKIKELADKGVDVKYGVRVRDNFNRLRNQVIDLYSDTNKQIKEKSVKKSKILCLAQAWNSVLSNGSQPTTPIERDLFMDCYKPDNQRFK